MRDLASIKKYEDLFEGADMAPFSYGRVYSDYLRLYFYLRYLNAKRHYQILDQASLMQRRTSDTLFIFGCGTSINDISAPEWAAMAEYNTLSLGLFFYCDKIRIDFHVARDILWFKDVQRTKLAFAYYGRTFAENPCFADTVFCHQDEWPGWGARGVLSARTMRPGTRTFGWQTKSRGLIEPPSKSFSDGLVHGPGTLVDAINLSYIMGFKKIVLVGVDLYDSRYFFIGDDGADPASSRDHNGMEAYHIHNTVNGGLLKLIDLWARQFAQEGIELQAYNPRSLLTQVLPIFDRGQLGI